MFTAAPLPNMCQTDKIVAAATRWDEALSGHLYLGHLMVRQVQLTRLQCEYVNRSALLTAQLRMT